ncbi:23 kDa integral membrane protein-like [Cydia fagiglandana]|uniref:23 kDa integral membrane protein-like n=1 Tax=Cydia fagiglandana TaxID=1458189 RepID=UPI002FEE2EFD
MGCGTCVKVIVFITNILLALASLALIGVGVAALLIVGGDGPIVVIVVGAIAFVISFLGCCGALMDSQCMLFSYSILLIILMNLTTALATAIVVAQDSIKTTATALLQQQFDADNQSISWLEDALKCCGTHGARSYPYLKLPASCCSEDNCTIVNAYPGCNGALNEFVEDFGLGIAGCCVLLVAIELIAVIFALYLANHVANKYKSRY